MVKDRLSSYGDILYTQFSHTHQYSMPKYIKKNYKNRLFIHGLKVMNSDNNNTSDRIKVF
jgi:hypothetical protein